MKVKKFFRTSRGWITATLYALPLPVNIPLQKCFLWACARVVTILELQHLESGCLTPWHHAYNTVGC